jgi:hypothetical protein
MSTSEREFLESAAPGIEVPTFKVESSSLRPRAEIKSNEEIMEKIKLKRKKRAQHPNPLSVKKKKKQVGNVVETKGKRKLEESENEFENEEGEAADSFSGKMKKPRKRRRPNKVVAEAEHEPIRETKAVESNDGGED